MRTLKEFEEVSERVQNYYHSSFGVEILPVKEIETIEEIQNDEVYLLENGVIIEEQHPEMAWYKWNEDCMYRSPYNPITKEKV